MTLFWPGATLLCLFGFCGTEFTMGICLVHKSVVLAKSELCEPEKITFSTDSVFKVTTCQWDMFPSHLGHSLIQKTMGNNAFCRCKDVPWISKHI